MLKNYDGFLFADVMYKCPALFPLYRRASKWVRLMQLSLDRKFNQQFSGIVTASHSFDQFLCTFRAGSVWKEN